MDTITGQGNLVYNFSGYCSWKYFGIADIGLLRGLCWEFNFGNQFADALYYVEKDVFGKSNLDLYEYFSTNDDDSVFSID